jgi:hypothetical protein
VNAQALLARAEDLAEQALDLYAAAGVAVIRKRREAKAPADPPPPETAEQFLARIDAALGWDRPVPPDLRAVANQRPEIAWLCYLPAEERSWYRDNLLPDLVHRFPNVSEDQWRTILR